MNQPHQSHPTRRTYVLVAVLLAIATGLELWVTTFPDGPLRTGLLLFFTVVKVGLVAAFFMHLKTDYNLYTAMFLVGFAFVIPFTLLMLIFL